MIGVERKELQAERTLCRGWKLEKGMSKDRVQSFEAEEIKPERRKGPGAYVHIKEFGSVLREIKGVSSRSQTWWYPHCTRITLAIM